MNRSKIMLLLRNINTRDRRRLRKFLHSPFFNENEELCKLYDFLFESVASPPNKKKCWAHLYPQRPYDDQAFRHLLSNLHSLALEFLTYEQLQKSPLTAQTLLLASVNKVELHKHFEGVVRSINRQSLDPGILAPHFHHQLSRVEHYQHQNLELSEKRVRTFKHLENADYQLDCYYISQKLKNYCDFLGYQKTLQQEAHIQLPPDFLEYVAHSAFLKEDIVRAYFLAANMMLLPDEEHYYQQLLQLLIQLGQRFEKKEQQQLFIHLINYCIDTKINQGRQDYFQELFILYKDTLKQQIIFNGQELDPQHYKNIITVGLYVRSFDWVEQFIQEYTPQLPESNQENALNYNLAKVYFQQEKYEQVIEQLREVEYKNISYALGGKLMLLKTYFELGEFLALDSLAESFRIYLRRNQLISKDLKQQYLNVIRFVRKLSTVAPFDQKALERIHLQIEDCKALADKAWILAKLGELNKSSRKA
ncbi:MAG: hypothetical protein KDC34_01860 [Saprospiraceae bacterium]|nr:hypothetical protein [Saprospiraceae bacterium]